MTTIVTRAGKGSPLTHTEVDTNFTNLNTAKLETAAIPLGTLAAPSISFLSDANTGIYSPEADTLAFVTAGSNRVHITSAGLVGIGTSAPDAQVEILRTSTTDPSLRLRYSSTSYYGDHLMSSNGDYVVYAPAANGVTSGNLKLRAGTNFSISTNNASVSSPALTIDTSGRVGIGTPSPSALLDVALVRSSATHNTACFGTTGTGVASDISRILIKNVNTAGGQNFGVGIGGVLMVNGSNQAALAFYYDSGSATIEGARLDSSGRLLVGTIASPAHQLQVSTDSAGKPSTNTWTIVSDERIKEEIELADLDLCYEAVKSIPLKRFKWKDEVYTEEQVRDRRKLGWIAQDVEAVFPKAVGTYKFKYNQVFEETIIPAIEEELDGEGNVTTPAQPERIEKGELISEDVIEDCRDLNSDQLYAAMYGAIQKLMVKVETLEIEVASLKAS